VGIWWVGKAPVVEVFFVRNALHAIFMILPHILSSNDLMGRTGVRGKVDLS
jgi:hypothetical protein